MREPTITTYRDLKGDCFVWEIRAPALFFVEARSWKWSMCWWFIKIGFRFLFRKWKVQDEK